MTVFKLSGRDFEKWAAQNKAFTTDFLEGNLLDSMFVQCSGGVAALFETRENCWSSSYTAYFGRYGSEDEKTVYNMWDTFAGCELFETA